jgi:very-short-patch-repair endonuclease
MSNNNYNRRLKPLARKLRKESTKGEVQLWTKVLRAGKMQGYRFNRQRPVLNYIADFMCKDLKLIIEIDGCSHRTDEQFKRDQKRQQELEEHGFTLLRFSEKEVLDNTWAVGRVIGDWIEENHIVKK